MARRTRLERAKPEVKGDEGIAEIEENVQAIQDAKDGEELSKVRLKRVDMAPPETGPEPEVAVAQKGPVMTPGQDYVAALPDGTFEVVIDGERIGMPVASKEKAQQIFNLAMWRPLPQDQNSPELHRVPIDWITPGPWLHRKEIDVDKLTELADSIRENGIRIPLEAVRKGPTTYLLFSGLRRYRAAGVVGLTTLPVLAYGELPDEVADRYSIIENLHREDLSPMDTARALEKLHGQGMTHEEIARALGKTLGWVSQYRSLLKLPKEAHKALEEKRISFSEARELERVADEPDTIKSILSKSGKGLEKRISYVPPEIGDRVRRVLEAKAREDKLAAEAQALKDQGAIFVDDYQGHGDKQYLRLYGWGSDSQAHDRYNLQCTVYAVYQGEVVKLCNDPKALAKVEAEERKAQPESAYDREQRERNARQEAQSQAISAVLRGWWESKMPVGAEDVALYVANSLSFLEQYHAKDSLDKMAQTMGLVEKKSKKEEIREKVKGLVFGAEGGEMLRYWWLYVMVSSMGNLQLAWLARHGYVDPTAPPKVERVLVEESAQVSAELEETGMMLAADLAENLMPALEEGAYEVEVGYGLRLYCKECQYESPESSPVVIRKELEEHLAHWCELRYSGPPREAEVVEEDRMAMEQIDSELTPEEAAEMEDEARELAPELFAEAPDA